MQICKQCQYTNSNEATFCNRCGNHLRGVEDPMIDRIIDKYQLEARIGGGGFGTVYQAKHIELESPFAIKVMHTHLIENTLMVERFRREARLLANLRHENIVQVIDFGYLDGLGFYLVMEWLEGNTFQWHMREEGIPPRSVLAQIFEQMLDALAYAHEHGVVHRDLKPENLILCPGPRGRRLLKLLDFGIARVLKEQDEDSRLTEAGLAVGTPRYMSPEQAAGDIQKVDHRSDIYACGVLLTELLTGKQLFSGTTNEILLQQIEQQPPRLSQLSPEFHFSTQLEDVIQRALTKRREDRFQSAAAFAAALLPLLTDEESPAADDLSETIVGGLSPMRQASPLLTPPAHSHVRDLGTPEAEVHSNVLVQPRQTQYPHFSGDYSAETRAMTPTGRAQGYGPPGQPEEFTGGLEETRSLPPDIIQQQLKHSTPQPTTALATPTGRAQTPANYIQAPVATAPAPARPATPHLSDPHPPTQAPKPNVRSTRRWILAMFGTFGGLGVALLFLVLWIPAPTEDNTPISRRLPPIRPGLPALPQRSRDIGQLPPVRRFGSPLYATLPPTEEGPDKQDAGSRPDLRPAPTVPEKGRRPEPRAPKAQSKRTKPRRKAPRSRPKRRRRRRRWRRRSTRRRPVKPRVNNACCTLLVRTIPAGVTLSVNGVPKGKTPLRIRANRGQKVRLTLRKAKYLSQSYTWKASSNTVKAFRMADNIFGQ